MVKKLIVFLFVVGMGIGSLSAQLAKTCFTNMPDSLSPLLTAVNRADFIDFLESKMKAEAFVQTPTANNIIRAPVSAPFIKLLCLFILCYQLSVF